MQRFSARMACALITLACANPALADDTITLDTATVEGEAPPILVEPTLMPFWQAASPRPRATWVLPVPLGPRAMIFS